jgi:hypothetical protein
VTTTLIINCGSAGGVIGHKLSDCGKYLAAFDPDAMDGYGAVAWTADRSAALRFADFAEAYETWRRRSTVRPLRPDGQPNRPLTAYTVTFETLSGDEPPVQLQAWMDHG